jgi:penicillin-binding protein 1C
MRDVSGITGAAPVWRDVMTWLHRMAPSPTPEPPAGVRAVPVRFPRGIEPPRTEWFLEGTEPRRTAESVAAPFPRIVSPVAGTVVALDPDIPPPRQRVAFEARGAAAARWVLDGTDAGSAAAVMLWAPRAGRHALALVGPDSRTLDRVGFVVRGSQR